ncbi:unnamed protein product [Callosobruchus maculatus]|uniref:L-xylulose reductase n=1 Tax=Callosobruchus maculatus TaxID=64391 RepID=A0A653CQJ6_CALMS|nr:unnamed protein product [Callosobruchus maculatus]
MEINFKGKRALVTGATKGIGKDIAIQLAICGAKVVAVGRSKELLIALKKETPAIETIELDISDWKATEKALRNAGPIDLLVNNAGVGMIKSLATVTEDDVNSIFNLNVKALINVTKLVIQSMVERNVPGSVVNISSQASLVGLMEQTVYCASKGAVDAFTRAAALEYGPRNIRVNSVNPTVIMTDMGRLWWSDPKRARPMMDKIPLNRFGEVREVTDAVLYLLSDKASMVNGVSLPIDGGFTAT